MTRPNPFVQAVLSFFGWVRATLDTLCDRPDHLQRLSIIGSGMAAGLLLIGIIAILVHFGLHGPDTQAALLTIPIIGNMGYGIVFLYALAQVALLGIIKGLRLSGPGGVNVEIETTSGDDDDDDDDRRRRPRTRFTHDVTITQPAQPPAPEPSGAGQISE